MEEWLANLISNVPLAVGMLIIYYFLSRDQNRLEEGREATRKADETARNKQIDKLLDLQSNMQTVVQNVGSILSNTHHLLSDHDTRLQALGQDVKTQLDEIEAVATETRRHSADTLTLVRPLTGTQDAVQAVEERLGTIEQQIQSVDAAIRLLHQRSESSEQASALRSAMDRANSAIETLHAELNAIRTDVRELLVRTADAVSDC